MKLRALPLGIAVGVVSGLGVFLVTLRAVQVQGGGHLILLRKFFPGYTISPIGCVLGMIWAFVGGFVLAAIVAFLYNWLLRVLEPRTR